MIDLLPVPTGEQDKNSNPRIQFQMKATDGSRNVEEVNLNSCG